MTAGLGNVAARGAGITLMSQVIRFALQLGSLMVLARLLSPQEFGVVAMVTAITNVMEIVRDFGLSSAVMQAKELNDAERTNLFWANTGIGTGCALVVTLSAPLIVRMYGTSVVGPIVLALGWLFVVSGVNTQFRAELSRSLRFKALAVTDIAAQAGSIAVAISLAAAGAGYWAVVGQQITLVVLTCASNVILCKWRPGLPRRSVSIRRFFRFGGSVLGTNVIGYATNNLDNVAIGIYWGSGPLGLYSRAYQLLMVPLQQVSVPMTRVVLPVLSRVQDEDETYARYVSKAQLVGCYMLASGFAVAAGVSVPLVALLFGPKWSGVAPIFAALAIGGIFRGIEPDFLLDVSVSRTCGRATEALPRDPADHDRHHDRWPPVGAGRRRHRALDRVLPLLDRLAVDRRTLRPDQRQAPVHAGDAHAPADQPAGGRPGVSRFGTGPADGREPLPGRGSWRRLPRPGRAGLAH